MKKWLALVLTGIFLFGAASTVLAKGPVKTKVNKAQEKKAVVTEKKTEIQAAKAQREELRALVNEVKDQHKETIALMKEIKAKRQTIKDSVNAIKEQDETSGTDTATQTNQVSADVKSAIKIMSTIKGLGVKNDGLWGQYNQARENKDIEQAKIILQQISDNIAAKNEQLKQISATLDGIIVDLQA